MMTAYLWFNTVLWVMLTIGCASGVVTRKETTQRIGQLVSMLLFLAVAIVSVWLLCLGRDSW